MNNTRMSTTLDRLRQYEATEPYISFEWHDSETDAVGYAVINSLRGGAAGGGTRMRKDLDKNEVTSLAKTMEIKFSVCGPAIGGAKSGINFDPSDPRKEAVLHRWYQALMPILKTYYGTGGDLNIDEIHEVIPITNKYGLEHPQEGVLMGHFKPDNDLKLKLINQLQIGVSFRLMTEFYSPDLHRNYTVADMITGWGVAVAVKHYYKIWLNQTIAGKRATIQGWGNVAAAATYFLAQDGVKIVGIIDRVGGLINEDGYSFSEVKTLFNTRIGNSLSHDNLLSFEDVNEKIWSVPSDIFIPAAASRLVNKSQLESMKVAGVQIISSGANVPFADPEIFMGENAQFADENFSVLADFIANCGMARVFAYLMQQNSELTDKAIFEDVEAVIKQALIELYKSHNEATNLMAGALSLALDKLKS
ncbi:MAG: Glu/Leu/Phe/Val dehydrogenase dimerization domain-containing protein [Bacteroidota bacterium]|nr:Glu/Leu/Phe/Val dehydrogenase dimerization domain-containing protein [Bacteroidota bacterium]